MSIQLGILALTIAAFAVFATTRPALPQNRTDRVRRQGSSPFLTGRLLEFGYYLAGPVVRLAVAVRCSPNVSSSLCLVLGVGSGLAAGIGSIPGAGALFLLSGGFDMIDGIIAREKGVASDSGEILDAAADRYAEFCFLAGSCVHYRQDLPEMLVVLAALLGSMLVSYSQAKAEIMQVDLPRAWMRRPERTVYLGASAFLTPLAPTWGSGPRHYLFVLALVLVGVFANADAIRRFWGLYTIACAHPAPRGPGRPEAASSVVEK
jgi:CDP-diacylglycerol--glycerol-3-phosphate 3-phosphatidyltransferase